MLTKFEKLNIVLFRSSRLLQKMQTNIQQPHVMASQGQPVVFQHQQGAASQIMVPYTRPTTTVNPSQVGYSKSYNEQAGRSTGWIQLCCAGGSILVAIAQLMLDSPIRMSYFGIWAAVLFYGPSGILGISSFRKRTSVISAYMALSIVSAIFAFFMTITAGISATISSALGCYPSSSFSDCQPGSGEGRVASDAILSVIGFIEFVIAIMAAAFCCGGVCCTNSTSSTMQHNSVVAQYPVVLTTGNPTDLYPMTNQPPPYTSVTQPETYQPLVYPPNTTGHHNAGLTVQLPNH